WPDEGAFTNGSVREKPPHPALHKKCVLIATVAGTFHVPSAFYSGCSRQTALGECLLLFFVQSPLTLPSPPDRLWRHCRVIPNATAQTLWGRGDISGPRP